MVKVESLSLRHNDCIWTQISTMVIIEIRKFSHFNLHHRWCSCPNTIIPVGTVVYKPRSYVNHYKNKDLSTIKWHLRWRRAAPKDIEPGFDTFQILNASLYCNKYGGFICLRLALFKRIIFLNCIQTAYNLLSRTVAHRMIKHYI